MGPKTKNSLDLPRKSDKTQFSANFLHKFHNQSRLIHSALSSALLTILRAVDGGLNYHHNAIPVCAQVSERGGYLSLVRPSHWMHMVRPSRPT